MKQLMQNNEESKLVDLGKDYLERRRGSMVE